MKNELKTLADAIRYFADEQVCIDIVALMRWPDGPHCPACLSPEPRQHWLKTQRRWQCRECGKQYSVKVNTIFEDSPISLQKWLPAMWLLCNCKNGISSYEVHRDLGITQKLGYRGGPVEMDETFIGGKLKNMHKAKKPKGSGHSGVAVGAAAKTIVVGMVERGGRVKAEVVAERTHAVLRALVNKHIHPGATPMPFYAA